MKKIINILKKSAAYTLAFQLSLSPLMASHLEDDILRAAKPSREVAHKFVDINKFTFEFNAYFLGSNGNNCFFNALGVTREDAVDMVTSALTRGSKIASDLLDKAIEDQIHECAFTGLQELSPAEKRAAYLSMYRANPLMIECAQNIGDTHDVANCTVTLFDVFSYVYRRNISVFRPSSDMENTLEIFHQVKYRDCTQPTLYLLLKGSHFNKLIQTNRDPIEHEIACMQEDFYLDELRARIRQDNAQSCFDEATPTTSSFVEDPILVASTSSTPVTHSSLTQDAPLELTHAPSTPASSSSSTLSRDEIFHFLLKKSPSFAHRTYNASCQEAWDTLSTWLMGYEKFAGQATLLLDHDFSPHDEGRTRAIATLIARVPHARLSKSQQHQINLYLGRLHLAQGNLSSAWSYFRATLGQLSFSQIGRLYMAKMIIEQDFRPAHLKNPIKYAQELLEPIGHAGKSGKRAVRTSAQSDKEAHLHNPYLTQSESHQTADSLKKRILDTRRHQETRTQRAQTSRAPSASASRSSGVSIAGPVRDKNNTERASKKHRSLRAPSSSSSTAELFLEDEGNEESAFFITAYPAPAPALQDDTRTSHTLNVENEENRQNSPSLILNNDHLDSFAQVKAMLLQAKVASMNLDFFASTNLCQDVLRRLNGYDANSQNSSIYKKLKARAYLQLANTRFSGELDGEVYAEDDLFRHALELATQANNWHLQIFSLMGLGNYTSASKTNEANQESFGYYQRAYDIAQQHNHTHLMIKALISMGRSARPAVSLQYYNEAVKLSGSRFYGLKKEALRNKSNALRIMGRFETQ